MLFNGFHDSNDLYIPNICFSFCYVGKRFHVLHQNRPPTGGGAPSTTGYGDPGPSTLAHACPGLLMIAQGRPPLSRVARSRTGSPTVAHTGPRSPRTAQERPGSPNAARAHKKSPRLPRQQDHPVSRISVAAAYRFTNLRAALNNVI